MWKRYILSPRLVLLLRYLRQTAPQCFLAVTTHKLLVVDTSKYDWEVVYKEQKCVLGIQKQKNFPPAAGQRMKNAAQRAVKK